MEMEKKNEKRGDAVSCPQVPVFILTLFKKNTYFIHSEKYGKIYVDVEGGKKENRKANQYVMPMSKFLQIYNQSNIYMVYDVAKEMKGIVCLVTLKIGKTIPKKSTGYQIYFLIIFILRTD